MPPVGIRTFALETFVQRSSNYYSRMVDAEGLPYFHVFWTDPAVAAHDWPDFGDVMSRQLQAAIMVRHMTGAGLDVENVWLEKLTSYLDFGTGLLVRPKSRYSEPISDPGDQALTLYALVTAYADNKDDRLCQAIIRMVEGISGQWRRNEWPESGFLSGFVIKSLMICARVMGNEAALNLAQRLVERIIFNSPLFTTKNVFPRGTHVHGTLRCLVGAADYAHYVGDSALASRIEGLYEDVREQSTRFGFVPELIGRRGDIVACETCAIMDYIGLATSLANHGRSEYWGDIERVVRNHLVESQITDVSWLNSDPLGEDTAQFTWREIGERMKGGYAGWSSPNYILACKETLNAHWGGPELRDKPRAFQNCCGGSGSHAFFIVWKNSARFEDGMLSVNLHIDKLLPEAEIRCYQPYQGLLTINMRASGRVGVRIPDFSRPDDMKVEFAGEVLRTRASGNYLDLGYRNAGEILRISYPLPILTEEISIGNIGFRQYRYRVTYKGDTVVRLQPLENKARVGYSEFDAKEVPVFYGEEGPGPLYQREHMLEAKDPTPAPLHLDTSPLDFWMIR